MKELSKAATSLSGTGSYRLAFANVDDRLCLWINGSLVEFGDAANLSVAGATASRVPTESDLCPVVIAVENVAATVSELLIERDIHYRANLNDDQWKKIAELIPIGGPAQPSEIAAPILFLVLIVLVVDCPDELVVDADQGDREVHKAVNVEVEQKCVTRVVERDIGQGF